MMQEYGADLSNLYEEQRETEEKNKAISQRNEQLKVPGLIKPSETNNNI